MIPSPVDAAHAIVAAAAARERLDRLVAATRTHECHTPECPNFAVVLDLAAASKVDNVWLALEALRRLAGRSTSDTSEMTG